MQSNMRAKIQAFGGFLTAMVIPNMGAFIAWGFIVGICSIWSRGFQEYGTRSNHNTFLWRYT